MAVICIASCWPVVILSAASGDSNTMSAAQEIEMKKENSKLMTFSKSAYKYGFCMLLLYSLLILMGYKWF